ncbi:hypothetical protein ACS0TY_028295 [Phlomoides rotata]
MSLAIGDTQICVLTNRTVVCWRQNNVSSSQIPSGNSQFHGISSGLGFSYGVVEQNSRILCWGSDEAISIQSEFANSTMMNIQGLISHVD